VNNADAASAFPWSMALISARACAAIATGTASGRAADVVPKEPASEMKAMAAQVSLGVFMRTH
jgi:hypothetical protein